MGQLIVLGKMLRLETKLLLLPSSVVLGLYLPMVNTHVTCFKVGISGADDPSGTRVGIVIFNDDYDVKVYPSDPEVQTVDDVIERLQAMQVETGKYKRMSSNSDCVIRWFVASHSLDRHTVLWLCKFVQKTNQNFCIVLIDLTVSSIRQFPITVFSIIL